MIIKRLYYVLIMLHLSLSAYSMTSHKENKGHFEWGISIFTFQSPHYRGSDETKNYFLPLPHFSYQSDFIEAEPSFIRGTFYKNKKISIKLSLLAGLAVDSKDNKAREGMPDLDYTFEFGPMVIFHLWESDDKSHKLSFEVPIRQVVASDFTFIQNTGFFSVPFISLHSKPQSFTLNWSSDLSIAAMIASRRNHDYYYSVGPEFAKVGRPEFAAKGGYSGTQLAWIVSRRFDHLQLLLLLRHDILKGVAFRDSPLFKKDSYTILGVNTTWIF